MMTTLADLYMAQLRELLPDDEPAERDRLVAVIRDHRYRDGYTFAQIAECVDPALVRLVGAWVR